MQSIKTRAGVDVSAKTLDAVRRRGTDEEERQFTNDAAGHRQLIKWVGPGTRVCVEATGVYHLALALALVAAKIEVMVANPTAVKDFGRALFNRSKTDKVDARTLAEYVDRMPWESWVAPSPTVLELRELGRRLSELVRNLAEEKNRLHSKKVKDLSKTVVADVKAHIAQLDNRIKQIERTAIQVIVSEENLREQFNILRAIRGVGSRSAILLLTELAMLDRMMTVKQLVAYAGLDPMRYESGTSVGKPSRISKRGNARLRAILYMNALSAVRHERGARLFYARMVVRGKKKMQALVAVMRKLLHGIWIVLQRRIAFDSRVLFGASLAQAESADSAVAATQPAARQAHPKGRSAAKELRQQLDPVSVSATALA